ncbi:MAG: hypothetical protein GTN74_01890, partial [Proteobacteria bacterium]|nr:hypothetical protein [Pseudomonadota bacterium]NIS67876.1 hypothetical protein [Pseudomonadota bacterium]
MDSHRIPRGGARSETRRRKKKAFVERMGTVTINMDEYEQAGVDMSVLQIVIRKIEDLPPLPLIVQKVLSLTQSENANTNELAKFI